HARARMAAAPPPAVPAMAAAAQRVHRGPRASGPARIRRPPPMRQLSEAAERAPTLAEIKQKTLKPADAWWVVFVIDPIAVRILWLLMRVGPRVTPNAVTSGSLVLGLLSAAAFWQGRYGWGALLFQLSFLLDCIDGKLGRLTGQSSPWGAFYDGFVNNVVFGANVLGLMASAPGDMRLASASALLLLVWALHIH